MPSESPANASSTSARSTGVSRRRPARCVGRRPWPRRPVRADAPLPGRTACGAKTDRDLRFPVRSRPVEQRGPAGRSSRGGRLSPRRPDVRTSSTNRITPDRSSAYAGRSSPLLTGDVTRREGLRVRFLSGPIRLNAGSLRKPDPTGAGSHRKVTAAITTD